MDERPPSTNECLLVMGASPSRNVFDILAPLNNVPEAWSIEPDKISDRLLVEVSRENFHENGSSADGLALDHPKQSGWVVLAPGDSRTRWEATYENGVKAVEALAKLTHLFEARRTIKHERPDGWIIRAYYAIETLLLDGLR